MPRSALPAVPFAAPVALLALAVRHGGPSPRKLPLFLAYLLRYTAAEPLRLLQRFTERAGHPPVADPIVILGHWRSGTTLLQDRLARDPRFATTTLFDTLLADVSGVSGGWLRPALNRAAAALRVPHSIQRQPLSMELAGEVDVGLCAQLCPHAYTWGHLFPRRFDDALARCVLHPTPDTEAAWGAWVDRYVARLAHTAGGRRMVLKSPGDTGRVAWLGRHWPDARFVFVHRDPVEVFHSTRYLWSVIRREFAMQTLPDAEVDAIVVRTYRAVMRAYLDQRDAVAGRLVEVAYADLVADPAGTLAHVYRALDLGPVPEHAVGPAGTPSARRAGLDVPPDLRDAWGFAFDAWGYDRPA